MEKHSVTADWDRYWRGTWEAAAHADGGPQDAALGRFWGELFERSLVDDTPRRMLDVAAGNGAVTGFALKLESPALSNYCLDSSTSALLNLQQRYEGVMCVMGDAHRLPFAGEAFDFVASQFGLEYAGEAAFYEAGSLVAAGGTFAAVLHMTDGAIYRECAENHRVLMAIEQEQVVELARKAFAAGFDLNAGNGSVEAFKEAERHFTPAVRALEGLLRSAGRDVAGGLLDQLYRDIAHMYRRMSAYAREDIISWLDGMAVELEAYAGRMQSMVDAAIDEETLQRICEGLVKLGLKIITLEPLTIEAKAEQGAWTLVARRE
jgi:SAM-dependent methyltransferase